MCEISDRVEGRGIEKGTAMGEERKAKAVAIALKLLTLTMATGFIQHFIYIKQHFKTFITAVLI